MAGNTQDSVDRIIRMVAVQVRPKDRLAATRVRVKWRIKEGRNIGEREVVRVKEQHLVKGRTQDRFGF